MKTSMLMKTVAALAIGAAFPLGAIAAPPAKTMIERGVIEKVKCHEKGVRAQLVGELKRTVITARPDAYQVAVAAGVAAALKTADPSPGGTPQALNGGFRLDVVDTR